MSARLTEAEVRTMLKRADRATEMLLARAVLALMGERDGWRDQYEQALERWSNENADFQRERRKAQESLGKIATLIRERDEARAVLREVLSHSTRCIGCVTFHTSNPVHHPDCRLARALGEA